MAACMLVHVPSDPRPSTDRGEPWTITSATDDDIDSLATIWYEAWRDGHLGNVPEALLPERRLEDFRRRVPERLPRTQVARIGAGAVGFVTVRDDELEELFVTRSARGTGIAAALLHQGEEAIASAGHGTAWLAVVDGNRRARAFYEHEGWTDVGPLDYEAQTRSGTIVVPSRRYTKPLRQA